MTLIPPAPQEQKMPFDLSVTQTTLQVNPNRFSSVEPLSPQAAQARARHLLEVGLSPHLERTLDLLLSAGALPQYLLPVDGRTLRNYHKRRLLDRLPYISNDIRAAFGRYNLPAPEEPAPMLVYVLGPVGIEIVRERHGIPPAGGYLNMTLERVMHDLAINEVVLYLAQIAIAKGWTPLWLSKYEATLWKDNQAELEPDAMLRLKKEDQEYVYLFEYHNEDKSTRAEEKVLRYKSAYQSRDWAKRWEVETFPPVLVVYRNPLVAQGYYRALQTYRHDLLFYGKRLDNVFGDNLNEWFDLQNKQSSQKTSIFTWNA
jgi:hypothetical protein